MKTDLDTAANPTATAPAANRPRKATKGAKPSVSVKSKADGTAKTRAYRRRALQPSLARKAPKWLATGASVTGVFVAIGATLFATRKIWEPRAKELRDKLAKPAGNQDGSTSISTPRSGDAAALPIAAPHFDSPGADAGFAVASTTI